MDNFFVCFVGYVVSSCTFENLEVACHRGQSTRSSWIEYLTTNQRVGRSNRSGCAILHSSFSTPRVVLLLYCIVNTRGSLALVKQLISLVIIFAVSTGHASTCGRFLSVLATKSARIAKFAQSPERIERLVNAADSEGHKLVAAFEDAPSKKHAEADVYQFGTIRVTLTVYEQNGLLVLAVPSIKHTKLKPGEKAGSLDPSFGKFLGAVIQGTIKRTSSDPDIFGVKVVGEVVINKHLVKTLKDLGFRNFHHEAEIKRMRPWLFASGLAALSGGISGNMHLFAVSLTSAATAGMFYMTAPTTNIGKYELLLEL